ncbi:MAG: hypothetical protein EOP20_00915, partial [Hyphomicrobiales bacterium]
MARIRTVKPEFWTSEQVMELSLIARLAFIGLWNFCDDAGVHSANAKRLKAEIFPSDEITIDAVNGLVAEMVCQGLVGEYESGGRSYWYVTGWTKHQRIESPTYRHPMPPGWAKGHKIIGESSTIDSRAVVERSSNGSQVIGQQSTTERKGKERKGEEKKMNPGAAAPESSQKISNDSNSSSIGIHDLVAEGIHEGYAKDWLKVRKNKRLTLTKSAWDHVKTEAMKAGITPAEAVEMAARKSWGGFEAEWALKAGCKQG